MTELTNETVLQLLKKELSDYSSKQIDAVLDLLEQGNTVPFIARYRKEMTGTLDEVQIREIESRNAYLTQLQSRKQEVIRIIGEQDKLTPELEKKIMAAEKMQKIEDLYRPYKQKKRTKATIAREKGLEPLAEWMFTFSKQPSIEEKAKEFISEENELNTIEDVLNEVHEILAEVIGDHAIYREKIREYTRRNANISSSVKNTDKDEKDVFEMYYEYSEPVRSMAPHRMLAINRGEKMGILKVSLDVETENIFRMFEKNIILDSDSPLVPHLQKAYEDSYQRFIGPAIEREIRNELTGLAEEQAINVFGDNLRNLLLQPPLKGKVVMGFDPAYRTGCKLAIVDATGKVLAKSVIYPHKPANDAKRAAAGKAFLQLLNEYQVEMVAIGNGTASRESELFVSEQIKALDHPVYYVIVNEAGASVYSASDIAREEFPDFQVEERSAVSIARRLQDPLAELVKIDPQSVGVGQYQHDVSQKQLTERLDFVVETAVNQVGVNLNTASAPLLQNISGLNKTIATNIVQYREENGAFTARPQLKKVARLGPKAFQQSVGFLRIVDGKNILDNTDIHPETYPAAKEILKLAGLKMEDVGTQEAREALATLNKQEAMDLTGLGTETLHDVLQGLAKPGRDLRDDIAQPLLRQDVLNVEDLQEGMEMQGTVRNVVDFGAFVDIGVKQDGLVHISKLSQKFIKHPSDVVGVGDIVTVWIESVDRDKGRIALTMLPNH
ncbi:RNA-binding transcriptional accessory protein [Jeotgalibaca sp. MA1X17-3]|uniref:Tex family protein n=1 Tax=Jeotgalibaca sp. MA1X17-3 TaxID=2908211 RepID=UPI001F3D2313|nr:Tex family protein [Jeotgalibaca sp. MA1X17-3]UJF16510.1 RNA-binding transcriptional accessory protein [Jeotgalibaca sp. MA1X17-3]